MVFSFIMVEYAGWDALNELGRQYAIELMGGKGKTLETRSKRQVRLANEIVTRVYPFLMKLAIDLVFGAGFEMPNAEHGPTHMSLRYEQNRIGRNYKKEFKTANKSSERELALEDLANEAAIRILERLSNYDQYRTGHISTFIAYNAIGAMHRAATQKLGLVRLPRHIHDRVIKLFKVRGREVTRTEKDLILDTIASNLTGSDRRMQAALIYLSLTGRYVCLDGAVSDYEGDSSSSNDTVESRIADEKAVMPDEKVISKELEKTTRQVLATVTPREEKVISMRFGIGEEKDYTLEETAQDFEVTRERIRQIESRALRRLRHPSRSIALRAWGYPNYINETLHGEELFKKDLEREAKEKARQEGLIKQPQVL